MPIGPSICRKRNGGVCSAQTSMPSSSAPLAWGELFSSAQLAGYAAFVFGMACFAQTDDRRFKIFMALVGLLCLLAVTPARAQTSKSVIPDLADASRKGEMARLEQQKKRKDFDLADEDKNAEGSG